MDEKEQPTFNTKRSRVAYQMEHPPKVCPTCLRSLSDLEVEEGLFKKWCFYCDPSLASNKRPG